MESSGTVRTAAAQDSRAAARLSSPRTGSNPEASNFYVSTNLVNAIGPCPWLLRRPVSRFGRSLRLPQCHGQFRGSIVWLFREGCALGPRHREYCNLQTARPPRHDQFASPCRWLHGRETRWGFDSAIADSIEERL